VIGLAVLNRNQAMRPSTITNDKLLLFPLPAGLRG
jgi:hypothetical protein